MTKKKSNQKNKSKFIALWAAGLAVIGLVVYLTIIHPEYIRTSLVRIYGNSNFQCVVYVEDYYQKMFDIKIEKVGNAQNLFAKAPNYGLYPFENGSVVPPQPGDILVFGHRNGVGHVAIVTDVNRNGVYIAERNWEGRHVSTNRDVPLKITRRGGRYQMENRGSFWVMGWVGRVSERPKFEFDLLSHRSMGWLPYSDVEQMFSDDLDLWQVKVVGANPQVAGPVYLDGIDTSLFKGIKITAKTSQGDPFSFGGIQARFIDGTWSELVPFSSINLNSESNIYQANFFNLPPNSKIDQIKIQLDNHAKNADLWDFDKIEIF